MKEAWENERTSMEQKIMIKKSSLNALKPLQGAQDKSLEKAIEEMNAAKKRRLELELKLKAVKDKPKAKQ